MKRILDNLALLAIIVGAVGFAGWIVQHNPQPAPIAFKQSLLHVHAQAQTVLVKTETGSGSGVVIIRGTNVFVWTAGHVVNDINSCSVQRILRYSGHKAGVESYEARVLARFDAVDCALLWVNADPSRFVGALWAYAGDGPGVPVFHVGNMRGANFDTSVTAGVISQVGVKPITIPWPWKCDLDQGDFLAVPGCSGGPVFNSEGEVIGILVGAHPQHSGISLFVPLRVLHEAVLQKGFGWAIRPTQWCPSNEVLEKSVTQSHVEPPKPDFFIEIFTPPPKKK